MSIEVDESTGKEWNILKVDGEAECIALLGILRRGPSRLWYLAICKMLMNEPL
jgi:hypothetical protein